MQIGGKLPLAAAIPQELIQVIGASVFIGIDQDALFRGTIRFRDRHKCEHVRGARLRGNTNVRMIARPPEAQANAKKVFLRDAGITRSNEIAAKIENAGKTGMM